MAKIKLAVIFGGKSSEYSVSLHSVSSAIRNMDKNKYDLVFIGISKEGNWFYFDGPVKDIEHDKWMEHPSTCEVALAPSPRDGFIKLNYDGSFDLIKVDCIFPIMHGKNGEDGTLQGLLELSQIPYVGCNHLSSAMSMDKEVTHIICKNAGIRMADYVCVLNNHEFDMDKAWAECEKKLKFPAFIKPANAGSSYGISKIRNYDEFKAGINEAFKHDRKVLIETGIDGFEVGCAVLGNDDLTVGEIDSILTNKDFFDFDAKYALTNTEIVCPARVDKAISDEVKEMSKKIFKAMGCTGLARVDSFISSDNTIYFNELNTIPGFTDASRYPSMMKAIGMDFGEVIDRLVELAMDK